MIGVGRTAPRLEQARDARVLGDISTDLVAAAAQADLLIFATPVNLIVAGVREAASVCRPGTLITDVGSTKAHLCRELSAGLPNDTAFIGSHPLAGSEKQGWEHSRARLVRWPSLCCHSDGDFSSRRDRSTDRLLASDRNVGRRDVAGSSRPRVGSDQPCAARRRVGVGSDAGG